MSTPQLPTYTEAAAVLEQRNGSGLRLLGWTGLRAVLIAVPLLAVGVDKRRAARGSLLASGLISGLALFRIDNQVG